MIKFLFPLLAVITCQNNLDGSWTCYDDSPLPSLPDSGIVDDGSGNYTCTNCVNMSPAECQVKKLQLAEQAYDSYYYIGEAIHEVDRAITNLTELIDSWRSFVPCPFSYVSGNSDSSWLSMGYPALPTGSSGRIADAYYFSNTILPLWHSTTNYFFCAVDPSLIGSNTNSFNQLLVSHNSLVGVWQASYETANRCSNDIEVQALNVLSDSVPILSSARGNVLSLYDNIQTNITCEACELGSSSGSSGGGSSGGGTGTDQGCMDCYLNYLRSLDSNVLDIRNSLVSYLQNVGNYTNELLRILRSINTNVEGISNHVARLDDYITDDFRSSFSNVVNSVVVISQQVDTVQRKYYEAFGRSNDHKDKDDQSYTLASMSRAVFDGPSGFDEAEFMKLDWQARQELLLYHMANPTEATNNIPDISNDIKSSQERTTTTIQSAVTELKDSAGAFTRSFNAVQNTIDNLANKLGGSGSAVYEITFLEGGSWLGDQPLVLNISPTVAGFCNSLFCAIWYCSAFAFIFYMGVRVFGLFVTVAVYIFKTFTTEL